MPGLRHSFVKRSKVAVETAAIVGVLLLLRLVVEESSLEFVTPGPLLTAVVAGGLFVVGLIVAATLSDYKESERMPSELVAALANILEDCRSIATTKPTFDLAAAERRLADVAVSLRADLESPGSGTCLAAVDALSAPILELERLEVPPNYIVRLRAEQGACRRCVLRITYIQATEFVPSAYTLIWTILALIIAVLTFSKVEESGEGYVLLAVIYFFFLYLVRLLKILDTPFQPRRHTVDDVSLFQVDEFAEGATPSRNG